MSEEAIVARKNRVFSGNQDNKDYAATEELHFDDFEAVAKAVLRQQKISATVSNHLTPQFAELDKLDKEKLARSIKQPRATIAQETIKITPTNQVSIDADVFDALVIGLAQLVNSQLRFADEFGLKQKTVFSSDIKQMQQRGSSAVLQEWLKGTQANASSKIDALFEDLAHHQAGLLASLDTIARRTIKYLGPELTRKHVHGLAKFGPMWPHYRKRNKKLADDQRARYKIILSPGVAYSYTKVKEKILKKKSK